MPENPKQKEERTKRDKEIFKLWPSLTLQQIGEIQNPKLTAERIRQIIKKVENNKIKNGK